jgi:hypothetical protein
MAMTCWKHAIFVAVFLATVSVFAQDKAAAASSSSPDATAEDEQAAIGEALANPLSYLWLAFMQNDTIWPDGGIPDALEPLGVESRPQSGRVSRSCESGCPRLSGPLGPGPG